jgi:hypothetical protein
MFLPPRKAGKTRRLAEALTLAPGALIGVSGGLAATHRPGKDVRENPDRGIAKVLRVPVLVEIWIELDVALWGQFQQLFPSDWLQRHQAVSPEEFLREPHRNRFASLLGRTAHLVYHFGQAILALRK